METFRVLFKNGSWIDVLADYPTVGSDGYVRLFIEAAKGDTGNPEGHDAVAAVFPTDLVVGAVKADLWQDQNIIPIPVDLSGECWPDDPTEEM